MQEENSHNPSTSHGEIISVISVEYVLLDYFLL